MAFQGWPAEAIDFLAQIRIDNSKRFFDAHRKQYEETVRGPMVALLADLESEFGPGKVFRPYRDIRFSSDKSPYKTNIAAHLEAGYVQLDADHLYVGSGWWQLEDRLEKYRRAVDSRAGASLQRVMNELAAAGYNTGHLDLKQVPRGYAMEHPRAELLKRKGVTAGRVWDLEPWLATPAAKDRVATALREMKPLRDWLAKYL